MFDPLVILLFGVLTVIGMTGFGASAPAGVLMKHFGFTTENIVAVAKRLLR